MGRGAEVAATAYDCNVTKAFAFRQPGSIQRIDACRTRLLMQCRRSASEGEDPIAGRDTCSEPCHKYCS
jgi:hypothetical protein